MLIDWFTVVAQVLNFLVLVWLLRRFLYRPILAALDKREAMIQDQVQRAEREITEAEAERSKYQQLQQSWDSQKADMLQEAEDMAAKHRKRLVEEARQEAAALRHRLEQTMREEHEQLNQEIALRTQKEVFAISRKVLKDLASSNLEEHMVHAFLHRVNALDEEEQAHLGDMIQQGDGELIVRSAYELPVELQKKIRDHIGALVGKETLRFSFESDPEKISGIEIITGGYKLAWSVTHYLRSLEQNLSRLLDENIPTPTPNPLKYESTQG